MMVIAAGRTVGSAQARHNLITAVFAAGYRTTDRPLGYVSTFTMAMTG